MAINSLSDLNTHSEEAITFTDDRPFSVVIGGGASITNNANANEGDSITPVLGQTIDDISSFDAATSDNVTLTIDLSDTSLIAAQFSWGTLPSGVTTSVSSDGSQYIATGIVSQTDLSSLISGASFEIVDQEVDFTYTASLSFDQGSGTETFTTTNNITIVTTFDELSVPANWTDDDIQAGRTVTVDNAASVIDTETDTAATYTITATIATTFVSSITSTGGGSASTATVGSNLVRTITGTLSQVNAHLNTLGFTLTSSTGTLTISYDLTNNLSGVNSTGSSTGTIVAVVPYTNFAIARSYTENQITTNLFATNPLQLDATALDDAFGESVFRVQLKNENGSDNLYTENSATPTYGFLRDASVSSKAGHQILEKTDSVTNLNTWLANHIEYIPPGGVSSTQTVEIRLWRTNSTEDSIPEGTKDITVNGTADSTPVSGAGTTTYTAASSPYNNNTITDNMRFFLKCDVLVVGAGGYGGNGDDGTSGTADESGGGGGAGQLTYIEHSNLFTARGAETFDVITAAKVPISNYKGAITYSAIEYDSTDERIKSWSGGYGGSSQTTEGEDGQVGGHGGGGAGDGTSAGSGGNGLSGISFPTFYSGGQKEYSFTSVSQSAGDNGTSTNGGDGGGYASGYTSSISGSSVNYAYEGLEGGDAGASQTTYGSGGHGGLDSSQSRRTDGQDGVVIIKLYEY